MTPRRSFALASGIFTMTNLGPLSFNNSGNPTSNLHTYTNSSVTDAEGDAPLIQFPNTAPPTVGVQYGGGGLDQGVDPNYRDPQSNAVEPYGGATASGRITTRCA